jgi:hypothetical protein
MRYSNFLFIFFIVGQLQANHFNGEKPITKQPGRCPTINLSHEAKKDCMYVAVAAPVSCACHYCCGCGLHYCAYLGYATASAALISALGGTKLKDKRLFLSLSKKNL